MFASVGKQNVTIAGTTATLIDELIVKHYTFSVDLRPKRMRPRVRLSGSREPGKSCVRVRQMTTSRNFEKLTMTKLTTGDKISPREIHLASLPQSRPLAFVRKRIARNYDTCAQGVSSSSRVSTSLDEFEMDLLLAKLMTRASCEKQFLDLSAINWAIKASWESNPCCVMLLIKSLRRKYISNSSR